MSQHALPFCCFFTSTLLIQAAPVSFVTHPMHRILYAAHAICTNPTDTGQQLQPPNDRPEVSGKPITCFVSHVFLCITQLNDIYDSNDTTSFNYLLPLFIPPRWADALVDSLPEEAVLAATTAAAAAAAKAMGRADGRPSVARQASVDACLQVRVRHQVLHQVHWFHQASCWAGPTASSELAPSQKPPRPPVPPRGPGGHCMPPRPHSMLALIPFAA